MNCIQFAECQRSYFFECANIISILYYIVKFTISYIMVEEIYGYLFLAITYIRTIICLEEKL